MIRKMSHNTSFKLPPTYMWLERNFKEFPLEGYKELLVYYKFKYIVSNKRELMRYTLGNEDMKVYEYLHINNKVRYRDWIYWTQIFVNPSLFKKSLMDSSLDNLSHAEIDRFVEDNIFYDEFDGIMIKHVIDTWYKSNYSYWWSSFRSGIFKTKIKDDLNKLGIEIE